MRISDWSSDVCSSDLRANADRAVSCPRGGTMPPRAQAARDMHYWRLPSVSSAWRTLFCEVSALLDRNCIFRLSAVSLTMFECWSPPDPMTSDIAVIREAWAASVCPQALDIASYQLPLSVAEAPGRDRTSVVEGQSESVRVDLGGQRPI